MVIGTGRVEGNSWRKKPVVDLGFVATEGGLNETKTSLRLCVAFLRSDLYFPKKKRAGGVAQEAEGGNLPCRAY